MNNMRNKILMTLALLLTAVTGAWADEQSESITTSNNDAPGQKTFTGEHFTISGQWADFDGIWITGYNSNMGGSANTVTISSNNGEYITKIEAVVGDTFDWGNTKLATTSGDVTGTYSKRQTITISSVNATTVTLSSPVAGTNMIEFKSWTIYYGPAPDPNAVEVIPGEAANTWTFTMPAFDVEIAPIYAPVAQWAKVENVDQLPTAIEGIFAGTTDAIVNAGTVVEGQGQVMYFATTDAEMTAEKAAQADGWLATVPTAEGYDGAQTVYVWYYIKGADTPDGQEATAENTFNDSEICETPIKVTVLSNKYDINFKAANDNTIQAGKATVKVGETAAQVDEKGNLTSVKMNSKVTVTAKEGYKFRKAEGKKHEVKD